VYFFLIIQSWYRRWW